MPTYSFRCPKCGEVTEVVLSMREYSDNPPGLFHCAELMERYYPPTGQTAGVLAGDRHYEGLRATDGTDISSRTKHRAYMREHGLTTIDDYKETWAKAQAQRDRYRTGQGGGAVTREDIAREWARRAD